MGTPTPLPFAPLTHEELNQRAAEARSWCGHNCALIVRHDGGEFDAYTLDRLRELGAEAADYHDAAMARVAVSA